MTTELRLAIRTLPRSRGFTMAATGVLALGIGAAATVFSVVDAILIRALPLPEANRLAVIYATQPSRGVQRGGASFPDLNDWRAQLPAFDGIFAFLGSNVSLTGAGDAERVHAALVSEDFFRVLREQLGVPVLLAFVAVIACYLPARRAASVDPAIALRADR